MYHISTHWSADNRIIQKQRHEQVESRITANWKTVWYKRLWFYFFEQEIRTDITKLIEQEYQVTPHHLLDPEYQALLARSALGLSLSYESRDEMTLLINDYLFGQGQFLERNYGQADELMVQCIVDALHDGNTPMLLQSQDPFMSDMLLELRRMRADIAIVEQLVEGKHTYQTLLKMCGEYVGTFARVPRFVSLYETGWSLETMTSAIDDPSRLHPFLEPQYTLECAVLDTAAVVPYGYVEVTQTPYATRFGKLGYRWAKSTWYVKLAVSIGIVLVSLWLGGSTLVILPIVWGILAVARTQSQYLGIIQQLLNQRYTSYTEQHTQYLQLYDTMVDPDQATNDTLKAQHLMSRWFDVIPFSGHELMWESTSYAKRLYSYVMSFARDDETQKDVAMMNAIAQWSQDHHLSILIVQDGHYSEQALYRFHNLLNVMQQVVPKNGKYEQEYVDQYDSIDELIDGKKYKFWFWTFRNALRDGVVVAISSGVLGWMGSYLWNWSAGGSSALAAGPSLLAPTLTESDDVVLSHLELIDQMELVMPASDIQQFLDVVAHHPSATLWDTMVDTFGYTKGNIYTNHLMDTRWKISDDTMTSELFVHALANDFPVSVQHDGWNELMNFLHRVYNYDTLQSYTDLLDKPWLSQTLQDLQSGKMTVSEFALLSREQREIITQALFYHLDTESLQQLFDGQSVVSPDPVIIHTGTVSSGELTSGSLVNTGQVIQLDPVIDTGAQTQSLELGQQLLNWLGLHTSSSDVVQTGGSLPDVTVTGDVEISTTTGDLTPSTISEVKLSFRQQFADWKNSVSSSWSSHFPLPSGDMFVQRKHSVGELWTQRFPFPSWSWDSFVTWKETIAHNWSTKFAWPQWGTSDLSGSVDTPDVPVTGDVEVPNIVLTGDVEVPSIELSGDINIPDVTLTGDIQLGTGEVSVSGEVAQPGFWSQFRTWLKGTPPVLQTQTGSIVNTGVVDTVLSGLNTEDLQLSGTVIDQNALAPGQITQFTLPVVRKDKEYG